MNRAHPHDISIVQKALRAYQQQQQCFENLNALSQWTQLPLIVLQRTLPFCFDHDHADTFVALPLSCQKDDLFCAKLIAHQDCSELLLQYLDPHLLEQTSFWTFILHFEPYWYRHIPASIALEPCILNLLTQDPITGMGALVHSPFAYPLLCNGDHKHSLHILLEPEVRIHKVHPGSYFMLPLTLKTHPEHFLILDTLLSYEQRVRLYQRDHIDGPYCMSLWQQSHLEHALPSVGPSHAPPSEHSNECTKFL